MTVTPPHGNLTRRPIQDRCGFLVDSISDLRRSSRSSSNSIQTFNQIGPAVMQATGNAQQPWVSASAIKGTFHLVVAGEVTVAPATASKTSEATEARAAMQNSTSVGVLHTFADRYGDTIYGRMARTDRRTRARRRAAGAALARADGGGGAPVRPNFLVYLSRRPACRCCIHRSYVGAPSDGSAWTNVDCTARRSSAAAPGGIGRRTSDSAHRDGIEPLLASQLHRLSSRQVDLNRMWSAAVSGRSSLR
jgi:hypothetical protein